jgi:phage shock protein A
VAHQALADQAARVGQAAGERCVGRGQQQPRRLDRAGGEDERAALEETFEAYRLLGEVLSEVAAREGVGADVVRLQRLAYDAIRSRTGLPAQLVLLGIRDFAARRSSGEEVEGIPLDDKLYALKGPSTLSVATVRGRVLLHYDVAGYREGWRGSARARLLALGTGFEIRVGVRPIARPAEETTMAYEGILSRAGRLVAGLAHSAIDRAESKDPVAVVEQAIREIDREAGDARASLGKHTAEQHRIESRRLEVDKEVTALAKQIETALDAGREDLAKAGVGRQIDLEAQAAALDVALADVRERIAEAQAAVQAILAARREAEARLQELKRSLTAAAVPDEPRGRAAASPEEKALRSLEAISRLTGVPAGPAKASEMDDLERLHRARSVEERLAALKSRRTM